MRRARGVADGMSFGAIVARGDASKDPAAAAPAADAGEPTPPSVHARTIDPSAVVDQALVSETLRRGV